jgi:outer membrane lipoprotein carrier protein
MRRALWSCGLLLFCSQALAQEPLPEGLSGTDKLAALIKRVSQVQSGVVTLQAGFIQRKTSRLLIEPSVAKGKFYFKAPDSVRWEYESPRPMTVLLAEGVAITYRPAEKRAERVEVGRMQRRIFRFIGAAQPLDQLKSHFRFTFRDPGKGGDYTLDLTPTTHQIKKRLKRLELVIDRISFMPTKVTYIEADGDGTSYEFLEIGVNKPIAEGLFTMELPADVEVVRLKVGATE